MFDIHDIDDPFALLAMPSPKAQRQVMTAVESYDSHAIAQMIAGVQDGELGEFQKLNYALSLEGFERNKLSQVVSQEFLGGNAKATIIKALIGAIIAAIAYLGLRGGSGGGSGGGGGSAGVSAKAAAATTVSAEEKEKLDKLLTKPKKEIKAIMDKMESELTDIQKKKLQTGLSGVIVDPAKAPELARTMHELKPDVSVADAEKGVEEVLQNFQEINAPAEIVQMVLNAIFGDTGIPDTAALTKLIQDHLLPVLIHDMIEASRIPIFGLLLDKDNPPPVDGIKQLAKETLEAGDTIAKCQTLAQELRRVNDDQKARTYIENATALANELAKDTMSEEEEAAFEEVRAYLTPRSAEDLPDDAHETIYQSLLAIADKSHKGLSFFDILTRDQKIAFAGYDSKLNMLQKLLFAETTMVDAYIESLKARAEAGEEEARVLSTAFIEKVDDLKMMVGFMRDMATVLVSLAGVEKMEDRLNKLLEALNGEKMKVLIISAGISTKLLEMINELGKEKAVSTDSYATPLLTTDADPFVAENYVPGHAVRAQASLEQFDGLAFRVNTGQASDADFRVLRAIGRTVGLESIRFGQTQLSQSIAVEEISTALKVGAGAAIIGIIIMLIKKFLGASSGKGGEGGSGDAVASAVSDVTSPPDKPRDMKNFDEVMKLSTVDDPSKIDEQAEKATKDLGSKYKVATQEKLGAYKKAHVAYLKAAHGLGIDKQNNSKLAELFEKASVVDILKALGDSKKTLVSFPNLRLSFLHKDVEGLDQAAVTEFVKAVKSKLPATLIAYKKLSDALGGIESSGPEKLLKQLNEGSPNSDVQQILDGHSSSLDGQLPFGLTEGEGDNKVASDADAVSFSNVGNALKAALSPLDPDSDDLKPAALGARLKGFEDKSHLLSPVIGLMDDEAIHKQMKEALKVIEGYRDVATKAESAIDALKNNPELNEKLTDAGKEHLQIYRDALKALAVINSGLKQPLSLLTGTGLRLKSFADDLAKLSAAIDHYAEKANALGKMLESIQKQENVPTTDSMPLPASFLSGRRGITLESVRFQPKDLFIELKKAFDFIINDGTYSTEAIKSAGVADLIRRATRINVEFIVDKGVGLNAYLILPNIDKNHPFIGEFYRNWMQPESGRLLIAMSERAPRGTVDTENCTIGGIFEKIPLQVHYGYDLLSDQRLTVAEKVAILLHELGHAFTYFLHLGQTVTSGLFAGAVAKEIMDAKSHGERVKVLENAERTLGIEVPTKESLAKGKPRDAAEAVQVVYLSYQSEKNRSETGHNFYEVRACEQIADQFAVKLGAGKDLAVAMGKLFRMTGHSSAFPMAFHVISETMKLILFIAGIALITPGIIMIIYVLSANPYEKAYDSPEQRVELIRRMLSNRLKERSLSATTKAEIQSDLALIDQVAAHLNDKTTLVELFWKHAMSKGSTASKQEDLNKQIESFVFNRLHEEAAAFSLL